ncbi:MAG: HdeD family acid-resistance protein [Bacilli bacterium]
MGRIVRETISERFSKMLSLSIVASIVIALIGVVLLFMPRLSNKIIGVMLGALFLLYGITTIYKYITRNGAKLYSLNLVYGIIILLIGAIIILVPFSVTSFLTICLGLYLIVMGLNKITYGVWFKIGNHSSWLITLVIGIMLIFFGILVLANPFSSLTITKLVGAFLILASILDITDLILLKNKSDEITKIFW